MKVEGTIECTGPLGTFPGGPVHVYVEDASRADGVAAVVATQTLQCAAGAADCRFCIEAGELAPSAYYLLRVHVDVDGDGAVSAGDYVTTESYRVVERAGAMRVRVFPVPE